MCLSAFTRFIMTPTFYCYSELAKNLVFNYSKHPAFCQGIFTEPHRTTPVLFFAMTAVGGEKEQSQRDGIIGFLQAWTLKAGVCYCSITICRDATIPYRFNSLQTCKTECFCGNKKNRACNPAFLSNQHFVIIRS